MVTRSRTARKSPVPAMDEPAAKDWSAWKVAFTPSWPIKLGNGKNILLSATFQIFADQPYKIDQIEKLASGEEDEDGMVAGLDATTFGYMAFLLATLLLLCLRRPGWAGVETTLAYDDRLWAFTRYQTGEEELYDLSRDPHRLVNLAGRPALASVKNELRGFWRQVWDRGGVRWKRPVPR